MTRLALFSALVLILLNTFAGASVPWYVIVLVLTTPLWWIPIQLGGILCAIALVGLLGVIADAFSKSG